MKCAETVIETYEIMVSVQSQKIQTLFQKQWLQRDGDSPCSNIDHILCRCHYNMGVAGARIVQKYDFGDTEVASNIKLVQQLFIRNNCFLRTVENVQNLKEVKMY